MRSERTLLALLLAGAAAVVAPALPYSRAEAQELAALKRRLDSLEAIRDSGAASLAAFRSRPVVVRVFTDTTTMLGGAVRFVTDTEFIGLARDAAARTGPFLLRRAGSAIGDLKGTEIAIWTDSVRRAEHGVVVRVNVNGVPGFEKNVFATVEALSDHLKATLQSRIGMADKAAFAAFSGFFPALPITEATNADWRAVRLELVSASAVGRRCYTGDIGACKALFGLVPTSDPATAWYDSAGRHAIIASAGRRPGIDPGITRNCLAGDDAECIALIRNSDAFASYLAPQASGRARVTLLHEALATGGEGSLARLARSPDEPNAALSAIANMPIDSLLARWQRMAHDGGVVSESATPIVALTAAGWILIMGALSTRSSRWR